LCCLDPMKGMSARYPATPERQERVHGYLSSPERQERVHGYLSSPERQERVHGYLSSPERQVMITKKQKNKKTKKNATPEEVN